MLIVLCLLSLIHMSISAENVRQNELDTAVNKAARTTIEMAKSKETYEITTDEQLIEEFNNNLLTSIDSDSDIEIQIMGVDAKEGFLDVVVINHFKYPTGAEGEVRARKTILYDETKRDE